MFIKKDLVNNEKGQAILIIILVTVISLTVGLSLATRTIVNLRNTTDQEASQKALSAAEAGIEQAIKRNLETDSLSSPTGFQTAGAITTYNTAVTQERNDIPFLLNGPTGDVVQKNDAIYVWVRPYTDNFNSVWPAAGSANFTVYWGENSDPCNNSAIEVAVIRGTKADPKISRYAYDGCVARRGSNFFAAPVAGTSTICGSTGVCKTLRTSATLNLSSVLLIRINPVYKDSVIGVGGSSPLASQGKTITSTGTADGTVKRKITVFEGYDEVPSEFFPYIWFNPR